MCVILTCRKIQLEHNRLRIPSSAMDNLEWKPSKAPDFQEVGRLSKDTGLNPLVASLLIQRGMISTEEVEDFGPKQEKLHDPF